MLAISSRRMRSAVSGVRSWCEASAAKSRSEASRLAPCCAPRASAASSRSTSSMPERSGTGRGSPGPSRSARSPSVARKWATREARRSAIRAATAMASAPATTTAPASAASTNGGGRGALEVAVGEWREGLQRVTGPEQQGPDRDADEDGRDRHGLRDGDDEESSHAASQSSGASKRKPTPRMVVM